MIELMFLFFMKNVSQCGQNVPFISKVLFKLPLLTGWF